MVLAHRLAWLLLTIAFLIPSVSRGGNLAQNGSFELGASEPQGWSLNGTGRWEEVGRRGNRSISVIGDGSNSSAWNSGISDLEPGKPYLIRFWVRRVTEGESGEGWVSLSNLRWNVAVPSDGRWHFRQFLGRLPQDLAEVQLQLGQRGVRGTISYDEVEVWPTLGVYRQAGSVLLGEHERIAGGGYQFDAGLPGFASNEARSLHAHTAAFDTDHWLLAGREGEQIIYRHAPGYPLLDARLRIFVTRCEAELIVEASRNGEQWTPVGQIDRTGESVLSVPEPLFPADELWVRLRATALCHVGAYHLDARLKGQPADVQGDTWYFAVTDRGGEGDLQMQPTALSEGAVLFLIRNDKAEPRKLTFSVETLGLAVFRLPVEVTASGTNPLSVPIPPIPSAQIGSGVTLTLTLREGPEQVWWMSGRLIYESPGNRLRTWPSGFGHRLSGNEMLDSWWSEATFKVMRETPLPSPETTSPIRLEAARNEYEPAQLVIRPRRPLDALPLRLGPFLPLEGDSPPESPVPLWDEVAQVDYVYVSVPTDGWGKVGYYPDPLEPLWRRERWQQAGERELRQQKTLEIALRDLEAEQNHPLWLTVYVPKGTPAGRYRASITLLTATDAEGMSIPVEVRVFDFSLPDETHLRTAYGVGIDNAWHRLRTEEQRRQVWDLYMQICRRYRISPYSPHRYAPIEWKLEGSDFQYDFSEFDRAMTRYLDEFHFNAFRFSVLPGELGGHRRFSPEWKALYRKLMEPILAHLRERGWLNKAYFYWVDEPPPEKYEGVKKGMAALKECAPGIRRSLTMNYEKAPSPNFYGLVDMWVPIFHLFDPERAAERQSLGEEVWWYVCTGPKAPYPNNFIDHPAITHRIRYWMAAKWNLDGDLYWRMTYYRESNPWKDGQSIARDGGYFGNGDGRLLYPPTRAPLPEDADPLIAAPIPSLRLALIAEGLEDFEYLWLLRKLVQEAENRGEPELKAALRNARRALRSPDRLIRSQTDYSLDAREIYVQRRRVAEAIERLMSVGAR